MIYILVTTTTCSKCPGFKKSLAEIGFSSKYTGDIIDENSDVFADLISGYQISSAPTLLLFDSALALSSMQEGAIFPKEIFRTSEISELLQFLEGLDKESKDSV